MLLIVFLQILNIKKMKYCFIVIVFFFFTLETFAQDSFENTLIYNDSTNSPKANLSQIEWITGHWRGEAFGGITEEVWTPNLGGSMMCAFKLVVNNQVKFYEIVTISEENGTLILRLKHFHEDLKGWEAQDETVDFKLVKITKNKVFFDGFTFERNGKKGLNIYVVIQDGKEKNEVKFAYQKVKS